MLRSARVGPLKVILLDVVDDTSIKSISSCSVIFSIISLTGLSEILENLSKDEKLDTLDLLDFRLLDISDDMLLDRSSSWSQALSTQFLQTGCPT